MFNRSLNQVKNPGSLVSSVKVNNIPISENATSYLSLNEMTAELIFFSLLLLYTVLYTTILSG